MDNDKIDIKKEVDDILKAKGVEPPREEEVKKAFDILKELGEKALEESQDLTKKLNETQQHIELSQWETSVLSPIIMSIVQRCPEPFFFVELVRLGMAYQKYKEKIEL